MPPRLRCTSQQHHTIPLPMRSTSAHSAPCPPPHSTMAPNSGVHEQLKLNVWIPYLFGVPPEQEALESAIISGGGILDRVSREWGMYQVPLDRNRC